MKKAKKLRLHRETLVLLDPSTTFRLVRGADLENKTSCTEPCGCPTGCTEEANLR